MVEAVSLWPNAVDSTWISIMAEKTPRPNAQDYSGDALQLPHRCAHDHDLHARGAVRRAWGEKPAGRIDLKFFDRPCPRLSVCLAAWLRV